MKLAYEILLDLREVAKWKEIAQALWVSEALPKMVLSWKRPMSKKLEQKILNFEKESFMEESEKFAKSTLIYKK